LLAKTPLTDEISVSVARMKRSEIREFSVSIVPDFFALHPGYARCQPWRW
jgi:hypothetical protein